VCGLIGTNGLETRSFAANREALLRAAGTSLGCSGDRVRDVCVRWRAVGPAPTRRHDPGRVPVSGGRRHARPV